MSASEASPAPSACTKISHPTKHAADFAIREHRLEPDICNACRRGGRFQAYRCDVPGHGWHVGHKWRRPFPKLVGPRQRRRPVPPAPPHTYWATKITTSEGTFLRCHEAGCQDATHANRAALGFDR